MSTEVRDQVIDFLAKNEGKYFTAEQLAEKLKLNLGSTAATMHSLAARAILSRRKDGKSFEYTAGKRVAYGQKYAGRRFPFHREVKPNGEAVPAASGGVGIIIKVDEQAHAITLADAKAIFLDLKALFG